MHPSVREMWTDFASAASMDVGDLPDVWHFCDNEKDANTCAQLVIEGKKRATAPSLWYFESKNEKLPLAGDLALVTNWDGVAKCIIRTTKVTIIPYNEITERHAQAEGEGNGTLEWWRAAHWDYYQRELNGTNYKPKSDMPIVFQEFECIWHTQC